jgi:hypothetical protein
MNGSPIVIELDINDICKDIIRRKNSVGFEPFYKVGPVTFK